MKVLLAVFSIAIVITFALADQGAYGYVYKDDDPEVVPGCTVMLCHSLHAYAETTVTNNYGYYRLPVNEAGPYHLWGWITINDTLWKKIYWVTITEDQWLNKDIFLEPQE